MVERTENYYPEHDIETRFDVNNNEDVNTVNKIRHWTNQSLAKTEDRVMGLTQVQTLDKSFTRTRIPQDKEPMPQGREYRWNMVDKQHRLGVKISGNINLDNQIFKMIDGLIVKAPEEQQVLETLLELCLAKEKGLRGDIKNQKGTPPPVFGKLKGGVKFFVFC